MEFVDLKGYEDKYEISTDYPYNIRNKKTNKILSESIKTDGLVIVYLNNKECRKHRIIAEQFNNDLPNGQGILENIIDNSVYNGNVKNCLKEGYGEIKYVDGTIYIGDFKNDKFDGKGKIIFSNGNKYEGEFINGKMGGEGVFTWLDGRQFFGNFVDNVKQGHGKLIWNENKYYEGNWFNNKLHGEGNFHLNGKIIRGKFRFGKIIMKEDELNGFY